MVNFMCQLGWTTESQSVDKYFFLDMPIRVFLDESNI